MSDWGVPLGAKVVLAASAVAAAASSSKSSAPVPSGRGSLAPGIYTRGELPKPVARKVVAPAAVAQRVPTQAPRGRFIVGRCEDDEGEEDHEGDEEGEDGGGSGGVVTRGNPPKRRKDAPAELSSTRGVSRFRQILPVARKTVRDPRFDASSGEFNADLHSQSYAFLDQVKTNELNQLKSALSATRDPDEAEALKEELRKRGVAAKDENRQKASRETQRTQKQTAAAAVAAGGGAFFPKKRDLKQLEAVEEFKKLAAIGKGAVERAIMKKRTKLSHKDKLALPRNARGGEGGGEGGRGSF